MNIRFVNQGIRYHFQSGTQIEAAAKGNGWTAWKHKCCGCGQPTNMQGLCKGCRVKEADDVSANS